MLFLIRKIDRTFVNGVQGRTFQQRVYKENGGMKFMLSKNCAKSIVAKIKVMGQGRWKFKLRLNIVEGFRLFILFATESY